MRRLYGISSAAGVALALAAMAVQTSCFFVFDIDDCSQYLSPHCFDGGTGGTPPSCIPSLNGKPIAGSCGVFVSSDSGDDNNGKGTKATPYKTIGKALANGTTIYACAGATPYSEALVLDKAATIFGALDCASWAYDATKKTALTAAPDAVPVTIASTASGAEVVDFAITAADAMKDGGSSIAVVVEQAMASFTRADIVAGKGKDGLAGTTPTDSVGPTDPNDPAIKGNGGLAACMSMSSQLGGDAKESTLCPAAAGGPVGGNGGVGSTINGGDASGGTPAVTGKGLGGKGETVPGWDCSADGVNGGGEAGANGGAGTAGPGAKDTDLGTLDKSGYSGIAGQPGGLGKPGQGGGGGGGAKGKSMCAGASGGGGGAGGCPGKGGLGGMPGGASIGIVSLGATLTFDTLAIKAGGGGTGGDGGDGEIGGAGGKGGSGGLGSGTLNACDGGNGGQGGQGGKGGGGRGGHAIGIAYTGKAPPKSGVTFAKGTAGAGGAGDNTMGNMGDGAAGVAVDVQVFQ